MHKHSTTVRQAFKLSNTRESALSKLSIENNIKRPNADGCYLLTGSKKITGDPNLIVVVPVLL